MASGARHLQMNSDYKVFFSEENPQLNAFFCDSFLTQFLSVAAMVPGVNSGLELTHFIGIKLTHPLG